MKVNIYKHAKDNKGYKKEFNTDEISEAIKSDVYKTNTIEYRRLINEPEPNKKVIREFKESNFKGVTWSGTFSHRNSKSLIKHTGLICIDIDNIPEGKFYKLRANLCADPFSHIVFTSPSGVGIKVIVKTDCDNAEDHKKKYFPMLQEYYDNSFGIEIDPSGSNVDRLCFLPWDAELFTNENSGVVSLGGDPASGVAAEQPSNEPDPWISEPNTNQRIIAKGDNQKDTIEQVKFCVEELIKNKTDITVGYQNWLKVGMALASLGEEGRALFHAVSSVNPDYDYEESDYKFSNFLKTGSATVGIASFFYQCKDAGVVYSNIKSKPGTPQTATNKEDWKEIYAYAHSKNRAGDNWTDSDIKFLSAKYAIDPEKIKQAFVKIFEKYKDQFDLDNKPDIYRVEAWLNTNYEFMRNEVTQKVEGRTISLDSNEESGVWEFKKINKDSIFRQLQRDGFKFAMDKLTSLLKSDFIKTINPFTEYFYGLPEKHPIAINEFDHISHLASYITMEDQEFWVEMFKKALVRSIACAIGGRENRIVMVFVQEDQNTGKSSFIRFLNPFGTRYYTEAPLRDGKDTEFRFAENFIYNLEELAGLNSQDVNKLKATISKAIVKERKPFAEDEEEMPRRCNFWASTNKPEFLTDNQNTRWLCFKVKSINHNYRHLDTGKTEVDINKVWAQAYGLYTEGYNYQLTADEANRRDEANKEYEQSSTEKDLVAMQFEVPEKGEGDFKNLTEIETMINMRTDFKHKINRLALGRAMAQLGFISDRKYLGSQRVRGYYVKQILTSMDYKGDDAPPF